MGFKSLAVMLGDPAAGAAAAKLAKRRKNPADSGVLAPGATAAPASPPPAPLDTTRAGSDAMVQAGQAVLRQRRRARAAPAGNLATPRRNPAALLQPRTLLGAPTSLLGG